METTWLDEVTIRRGSEASWQGGTLKVGFLSAEPHHDRSLRGRWRAWRSGGNQPVPYLLQLCLTAPGYFERLCWVSCAAPTAVPVDIATSFEEKVPLFAPRRGTAFELRELHADASAVVVRAGSVLAPPSPASHGDLAALAPEARAFIEWWLACSQPERGPGGPGESGASVEQRSLLAFRIAYHEGAPGQVTTTFHRAGDRFYVRTYGSCFGPVETWHGPFVARGARFGLAPSLAAAAIAVRRRT